MKNYMFFLTKKIIRKHNINSIFLDAGCGKGDVSKFLIKTGFKKGKAIDYSKEAAFFAKTILKDTDVKVECKNIFDEKNKYDFIVCWDVLEHNQEDTKFLQHLKSLLTPNGYLLLDYVTKKKEWRKDDYNYGHYKRYEIEEIYESLKDMEVLEVWDYTFPLFWLMRRLHTRFLPLDREEGRVKRTEYSSYFYSGMLWYMELKPLFYLALALNYPFRKLNLGHQSLVLVRNSKKHT